MLGVFLTTNEQLLANLVDPGVFLFGALLVLFGMALPLTFLLRGQPFLSRPLFALLVMIELLCVGILFLDFASISTPLIVMQEQVTLARALAEHRWVLFQLPLVLIATAAILLVLYKESIAKKFARDYWLVVVLSVTTGFAAILAIAFESLIV